MEPGKGDSPKLPDMVMCGDHPSIITGDVCLEERDQETKEKTMSSAKLTPSVSQIEEVRSRPGSEHTLRLAEARRRVRSLEAMRGGARSEDAGATGNRALVQAALGSFRWPPYLVAVWVLVLILTHALHCLVSVLERGLPNVRKCCHYFRSWTEESWKGERETSRLRPLALAAATGLLYAVYCGLYAAYRLALWALEPLADDDKRDVETKVTNYLDEVDSKTNTSSSKH